MGSSGRRATHAAESRVNGPSVGRTKKGTQLGMRLSAAGSVKDRVRCASSDDEAPRSSKQVTLHDA